jgi:NADH-quinone oxidoreductase subunit N
VTSVEALLNALGLLLVGVGLIVPTIDYGLKKRVSRWVSLGALLVALGLSVGLMILTIGQRASLVYGDALKVDFFGAFLFTVVSLGALLVTLASFRETRGWTTAPSYFSLILIITAGVYYIVSVNDLVLLLAAWALVSVASYAIVGVEKDENSLEGAGKYALMGIAASAFMLYGIAVLVGMTGSTDIGVIAGSALSSYSPMYFIAVIMLVAAFGFKIGVVPFHGWLVDVYGGVHPLLISFIAGIVKVSGVAALLRIVYPFAVVLGDRWVFLFAGLAIVTMTFGNVAALVQRNFQKMMGYSSLAHVGYMLVGFAGATSGAGAVYGVEGVGLHLAAYVLATTGIFVALAYFAEKGLNSDLESLGGLWRRMPVVSVALVVLVLSLIGMPPLLGFWSKFLYLFISPLEVAPWLTLVAVVNTGISVGYYGQIIRYVFLTKGNGENAVRERVWDPEVLVVVVTALLTVILGLGIAPLLAPYLNPYPIA